MERMHGFPSRLLVAFLALGIVACEGTLESASPLDAPTSNDMIAAPGADFRAADAAADMRADGPEPDAARDGASCAPRVCEADQCGREPDGCGGFVMCRCTAGLLCTARNTCEPPPHDSAPVALFTDVLSGPSVGWEDRDEHGTLVTLWGRNFGPERGDSFVSVHGVDLRRDDDYLEWAEPDAVPGLQTISFLVPGSLEPGEGEIRVTVGGEHSAPLPFTVRDGRIRYVSAGGTGDGTYGSPWGSIAVAAERARPGDLVYVGEGVTQASETAFSAAVNLGQDGEANRPIALIGLPGAMPTVGNPALGRAFHRWNSTTGTWSRHWVIARFRVVSSGVCITGTDGFRIVGNVVSAPRGDGQSGCIHVEGNDLAILGNEVFNVGAESCSKLYHALYISGVRRNSGPRAPTERNRHVAWNYFHDNRSNRAINVYSEQSSAAYLEAHRIHDNLIVDQRGDGILLGWHVVGENWVYNNLIVRAGLGPDWVDDASSHAGMRIEGGAPGAGPTTIHILHNTVVDSGWTGASFASGNLMANAGDNVSLVVSNNVFAAGSSPNIADGRLEPANHGNAWVGDVPAWDRTAVPVDDPFVGRNDYRLRDDSPAVDSAYPTAFQVNHDLESRSRPAGAGPDFGAYER
ncbi:MAG: choice-of-anchor Q domain-containing protein [Myxococcota bacterium]